MKKPISANIREKDKLKGIEDVLSEDIPANTWGKLRAYLAKQHKTGEIKYSQAWIKEVLGDKRTGRRIDVGNKLRGAM